MCNLPLDPAIAEEVKFDNSSIEALQASMQKVLDSMDPDQKQALGGAIFRLSMIASPLGQKLTPEQIHDKIGPLLDGHTGKEVIDLYNHQ
ncbi:hypothetical protein X727_14775 [Mesorhizobium sp. L103C119B0]|nr:hypothetical protein X727_14775 [Mesorhizobium sp. L103C119B0]